MIHDSWYEAHGYWFIQSPHVLGSILNNVKNTHNLVHYPRTRTSSITCIYFCPPLHHPPAFSPRGNLLSNVVFITPLKFRLEHMSEDYSLVSGREIADM